MDGACLELAGKIPGGQHFSDNAPDKGLGLCDDAVEFVGKRQNVKHPEAAALLMTEQNFRRNAVLVQQEVA